jgi:exodeoxyribonuclease V alpha subunit
VSARHRRGDEDAIRPIDRHFGEALVRWSGRSAASSEATLLRALGTALSAELGRQHSCIELGHLGALAWPVRDADGAVPGPEVVRSLLLETALVGDADRAPLVLDGDRLYLGRYHRYETRVAEALRRRAASTPQATGDVDRLRTRLEALFPADDAAINWQRVGAAMALDRPLAVITGGPGTGKTTTVTRMLLMLLEQSGGEARLRIRLCAPTGKAAARLTESIRLSKVRLAQEGLAASDVLDRLPETAETLHRLLAYRPLENRFRYGAEQQIPADVVVVDEASMVDLRMMAQLLDALRPETRLVLLGDKDQLSSVEAGRVLGDLCAWTERHFDRQRLSRPQATRLSAVTGFDLSTLAGDAVPALADCLCLLERSHRFDAGSAMGRFATAVNGGDPTAAFAALEAGDASLTWSGGAGQVEGLVDWVADRYAEALSECVHPGCDPGVALAAFGRFQLLAATRRGSAGVERLNEAVEARLARRGLIRPDQPFYAGRPLMVVVNDYALGLYNGDVGLVLADAEGQLRAWFADAEGGVRDVRPGRLPAHETTFAMTVHKSQGSEFDRVAVALPDAPGENERRLLTREMLYTAVTRARSGVHLHAGAEVVRAAIAQRTERTSGLRVRLWGEAFDENAEPGG